MGTFARTTTSVSALILLCLLAASLQAQTAQFLWEDSTTLGAWQSVYGNDGYNVIGPSGQYQSYPSYAAVTPIGQTEYTSGTNLSVLNGLQEPGVSPPNNRIAAQWYSNTSFTLDINLTDGQVHQVALYCLDYGDTNGRAQTVTVVNPQNGNILDTRTEDSFTNGQYLIWNLSGHVQIQLSRLAAYNATVSGLFFDPPGKPSVLGLSQQSGAVGAAVTVFGNNFGTTGTVTFNGKTATTTQWSNNAILATVPTGATSGPVVVTASSKQSNNNNTFTVLAGQTLQFLGVDSSTEGTWESVYGADGYNVISATTQYQSYPSYATVTPTGQTEYTWGTGLSDPRGLQEPGVSSPNNRIAAAWYSSTSFTIDLNLTDGNVHEIAVYCLDWGDNQGRAQTVSILNAQNGSVLDAHTVTSFASGKYLVWNLSGHIQIQVTDVSGVNAVISGLLFSPSGQPLSTPYIWGVSQNEAQVGTSVTVVGTNFGTSRTLAFNGTNATPTQSTNTSITAPVPTGATTGNIVVTSGTEASNGIAFTVTPTISSIVPTSGPISTVVQINGTGFGNSQGSTAFLFNGTSQTPGEWTSTLVTSQLPDSLVSGPVYISIGGSNPAVFTLLTAGGIGGTITNSANGSAISGAAISLYLDGVLQALTTSASTGAYSFSNLTSGTYSLTFSASEFSTASISTVPVEAGGSTTENIALSTPQITALSPSSGSVGTSVTITGTNFGSLQGLSTVAFGSVGATTSQWSNTAITVAVPSGATTGSVTVTVGGAVSSASTFTVGNGSIQGAVTSGGTGVTGANVNALQSGVVKATATSGSGGSYSIGSLAPGKYDMDVAASGYGTQAVSGITVNANAATTENFALSTPGTISGIITESDGTTAISGATVSIYQGYTVVGTATTNSSGAYSVATLAPATYAVTASSSGFDTTSKSGQVVTSGGTTTTNISLTSQATISYAYDEAGRLASVVDSLNNSAAYNYDAVGNIQSIVKKAATTVAISEFVPNTGPVGTTVNVYGSGFSSTPSQDTVTFNGTTASVMSATPTQLTTTVPTGATTGTIKVVASKGSATSTASFTIASSNGLPTITSFTPTIANPGTPGTTGTTVTITGTNFNSTASNDGLAINVNKTYAATATGTTTLTTTLPGVVTSGHVTVTTTVGSFTTSSYLFVAPSGYTASQVGYTGQVSLGGQVTASLNTANTVGLIAVDVAGGQGLWITTASHFSSTVAYQVYDPYGNVIGTGSIGPSTPYISTTRNVSGTGTCIILINPGSQTGSVILSPVAIPPVIKLPILVNGPAVNVTIASLGQSAFLTFNAFAGERINLLTGNVSSSLNEAPIGIINPDGTTLWSGSTQTSAGWYWNTGLFTLAQTGSYTLFLGPSTQGTGGVSFTLSSVPADIESQISVNGQPVTTATTAPFQNSYLTFNGALNQRINWLISAVTGSAPTAPLGITGPYGTVFSGYSQSTAGWFWNTGVLALPGNGVYTIFLQPSVSGSNGATTATSGATFTLSAVPPDIYGPIVLNGQAVASGTSAPFQSGFLTFSGSQSQVIYLKITNTVGPAPSFPVGVLAPNGNTVFSGTAYTSSGWQWESGPITLNGGTGTYEIYLKPSTGSNGTTTQTFGGTFAITSAP